MLNSTQFSKTMRSKPESGLHLGPTPRPLAIFSKQYSLITLLKIFEWISQSANEKHLIVCLSLSGGKKIEVWE